MRALLRLAPIPLRLSDAPRARDDRPMPHTLPDSLAAHPPIVKTCGHCSHWQVPVPESSANPRGDAGMAEQGLRPCSKSGQAWRYLSALHRCHLINP